ncbi:unnamed protein product [Pedinophyceae sp. YPF-701]|nr:unnamed protein product [Pedinophyceae sp. YPF-701]
MYCSTECQKSDWPRHKKECKHIARLGLWGCPFTDEQMLARQPLGTAGVADAPARDGPRECGICGRTSPLKRTACCGEWVCDRDDEYELMSYSREFCHRSHERYTICGTHHSDRNHRGDQDWRTCGVCEADFAGQIPGTRLWYSTNGYNFVPGLEAQYPKGSFITTECCECRRRLYLGTESYSAKAGNGVFLYSCDACSFR